jgi:Domain of unknown function (DUF4440)
MKNTFVAVGFAGVCCAFAVAAHATEAGPNEAGVREAENAWSRAFVTGDTALLDRLLDPAYVSVNANGAPRSKAEILDAAARFAAQHPNTPTQPLPPTSTISVKGESAVVTHHAEKETSVDIFYYSQGRWHAWYSQHTARLTGS